MEIPVLPIKGRENGELLFANGENLEGCYWFEEILFFIEKGGLVKKIIYSLEFKNFDYVFNEYSSYFSEMRKKSKAHSIFGKNMNNFLYGRFAITGSKNYSFFVKGEKLDENLESKEWNIQSLKKINNMYLITIEKLQVNHKEKLKNNVSISAMIASKARIKLYKAQETVLKNKGRILYSDTDSIYASFKDDISGQLHGEIYWDLKKEKTCIQDAVFISSKLYGIKYNNGEIEIKIKNFIEKSVDFENLKKKFYGRKNKEDLLFYHYNKRIFSSDKKETSPLFL